MKISFSTDPNALNLNCGYGVAGFGVVRSLQNLGHTVPYQDASAPVEIHWSNPNEYRYTNPDQYKIAYSTWESYPINPQWKRRFEYADEVWTTTPIMAEWYEEALDRDVHVYEHGIDPVWKNKRRKVFSKIKFLHDGEPAPRKNGQMALDAFRAAFGDRTDVHLTLKAQGFHSLRVFGNQLPENIYPNVSVIKDTYTKEQMVSLYHSHQVLVMPSEAEGFGLPGLQGLASGMPSIINSGWSSYKEFIDPNLELPGKFAPSVHQNVAPGYSFPPSFDDLVDRYIYAADHFDDVSALAYKRSSQVHERYNWENVTRKTWQHIFDKFED